MKRQRQIQLLLISALTLMTGFMLVGFAAYSEELKISGTTDVANSKWSIHFMGDSAECLLGPDVVENSFSVNPDGLMVNFDVAMSKPGTYYQIKIPIINDGTFDAHYSSIEVTGIPEQYKPVTRLQVFYESSTALGVIGIYDSVNGPFPQEERIELSANSSQPNGSVYFILHYLTPPDPKDLPQEDLKLNISVKLNFEQG